MVNLITQRSVVQIHPPSDQLPVAGEKQPQKNEASI